MARPVRIEAVSRRTDFETLSRASKRATCGVVSVSFADFSTPTSRSEHGDEKGAGDVMNVGEAVARVSYAVSRHTGNAVVRNRVRRRFRSALSEFPLAPGLYLVRPRSGVLDAAFTTIQADLFEACTRVGAIRE
jgi:ribonuclease P protein component